MPARQSRALRAEGAPRHIANKLKPHRVHPVERPKRPFWVPPLSRQGAEFGDLSRVDGGGGHGFQIGLGTAPVKQYRPAGTHAMARAKCRVWL